MPKTKPRAGEPSRPTYARQFRLAEEESRMLAELVERWSTVAARPSDGDVVRTCIRLAHAGELEKKAEKSARHA